MDDMKARLELAKHFIEDHLYKQGLTVDEIAEHIGVSRPTLQRAFLPFGGASTYLWDRRLERAYICLDDGKNQQRVREIALSLGFPNNTHFSRVFKKAYGRSPSAVREDACARLVSQAGEAQMGQPKKSLFKRTRRRRWINARPEVSIRLVNLGRARTAMRWKGLAKRRIRP